MSTLAGFGVGSRRASRFEPLRGSLLGVAVAVLTLALVGLAATIATYQGWDGRAEQRAARDTSLYSAEPVRLRWSDALDHIGHDFPVHVIYLDRVTADAPLPPGLASWPEPGEAVVSPAVADRMRLHVGADSRWGTVTGTVRADGLVDPGEGLVYVGATGRLEGTPSAIAASGFGTDRFGATGAMLYRQPLAVFTGLVTTFAIAPAAWLLVTALRVGAPARARRVRIVTLLGARPAQVRSMLWGEARRAWTTGIGAALAVTAAAATVGLPLPGTGFLVQGRDLRSAWALVAAAVAVGAVVTWAACRSSLGSSAERAHADGPAATSLRGVRAWAPFVLAAGTVIGQNLAVVANRFELVLVVMAGGAILTLATVPAAMAEWGRRIGSRARTDAWAQGRAGTLTGAAQLAARPRRRHGSRRPA